MKPTKINIRTALACSNLWKIDKSEKDQLDRFFLLFDDGEHFFKDIEKREDPKYPYESEYFLKNNDDNIVWNIRFLKSVRYLKTLGNQQIALSYREHKISHFNWIIVSEWKEKEEKKDG